MSLTNTATRYGTLAKSFHWTIALGILVMIPLGIVANALPFETTQELARKATLFSVHKTVGVALFALAILRIGWALSQPKPAALHPDRRLETFLAELVHWLLYGSLILVPLSGWIHHAATSGFAPIWGLGQTLPLIPQDQRVSEIAAGLHIVFERVLAVSLLLHIAGALKHHIIDRDTTLRRMWFGAVEAGAAGEHRSAVTGIAGAVSVWAVAIGIGAGLGLFSHHDREILGADLAAVQSDWQVQEGTLGLTISQFGSPISGSFADWTAEIRYEASDGAGQKGDVSVVIAIPSLSLGTVTAQAMGADFFDAETFPTATFTAPIFADETGALRAEGTLTIRDVSLPLTLPFTLDLEDGEARMSGATTIDRNGFGIGSQMSDASQLGFDVEIDVALTAQRQ